MFSIEPTWISFGGTSALITSMGLILGLDAAASGRQGIISALLIIALADNLSDSLSVQVFMEAERLEHRKALISTVANFCTRLLVALSFVALVIMLPRSLMALGVGAWGFLLLISMTYWIARAQGAHIGKEIGKHIIVAVVALAISRWLGIWIGATFG